MLHGIPEDLKVHKNLYEIRKEKTNQRLGIGQPPCHAGNMFNLRRFNDKIWTLGLKGYYVDFGKANRNINKYNVTKSTRFLD